MFSRGTREVNPIKGVVFVAAVAVVNPAMAMARDATGIYLTAEDYKNAWLTSESNCDSSGHKVELHDVLHKSFIHVTHDGVTRKYLKSEIYGSRTCEDGDYRFVGNREYQILEAGGVLLYSAYLHVGRRSVRRYFFSNGADGQVLRLTRDNLKRAFPDNHRFHDALDQTFKRDDDLIQFDDFHRQFKVNRLLSASLGTDE